MQIHSNLDLNKTTTTVCISRRALKEKKYIFRDIHNLSFSAKIQDGRQKWQKLKFFPRHRILLYYPVGQKFALNRSISYHFEDIFNVLFSAKIQDGHQKWQKLKFFPFAYDTLVLLGSTSSLKIALSLTVFEIFTLFHFPQKSTMATKSGEN